MIRMFEETLAADDQETNWRALVEGWLEFMRMGTLPASQQHLFRDSEHQEGQDSGAAGAPE